MINLLRYRDWKFLFESKTMAPVPEVPSGSLVCPTSWGSRNSVKAMLEKIWTKYKTDIEFVADELSIAPEITISFIAVESAGNSSAGTAGHETQGLMQWNRNYAKSNLEDAKKNGRLSDAVINKLSTYGVKFDADGKTKTITNADQLKPGFNILMGSIILNKMSKEDWGTDDDGSMRLDRMIAVYNAGPYGDTGKKARLGNYKTPEDLAKSVNPTTRAYISKIFGKNGTLDIIKTDGILSDYYPSVETPIETPTEISSQNTENPSSVEFGTGEYPPPAEPKE
jgi:hypothetical protein